MTPEERAHDTWVIIAANNGFKYQEYIEEKIAAAIRAAIEEEREACAIVAENTAGGHYMAKIVAAAIRARGKEQG